MNRPVLSPASAEELAKWLVDTPTLAGAIRLAGHYLALLERVREAQREADALAPEETRDDPNTPSRGYYQQTVYREAHRLLMGEVHLPNAVRRRPDA